MGEGSRWLLHAQLQQLSLAGPAGRALFLALGRAKLEDPGWEAEDADAPSARSVREAAFILFAIAIL